MLTLLLAASLGQAPIQTCPFGQCPRVQQAVQVVGQTIRVNSPPATPTVIPQQMPSKIVPGQPVRNLLRRVFGKC